jgi:hypothetical protein
MGKHKGMRSVRNQAMNLYESGADDLFHQQGYLVIDSSLGMMRDDLVPSPEPHLADPDR